MPRKTSKKQVKRNKKNSMKKSSSCFNMMGGSSAAEYAEFVYGNPSQQTSLGAGSNEIKIMNDPSKYGITMPMKGGSVSELAPANYSGEVHERHVYGDMSQQSADPTRGNEIAIKHDPSTNANMKGGMKIIRDGAEVEVADNYNLGEGETMVTEPAKETVSFPSFAPPTVEPPTFEPPTFAPPTFAPPTFAPPTFAPPPVTPAAPFSFAPPPSVEQPENKSSFFSSISNMLNPNKPASTNQADVVAQKVVVEEQTQKGGKSIKKYTPAVLLYAKSAYKSKNAKTQRKRKMRSTKKM
jgi:hypothetical protein